MSIIPQQRKLMGSSAQISSGVCRCGSQEQVPEEGSRRFRRVPVCAGVGSGGRFRKVPVCAGAGSRGKFRKVLECARVGSGGGFQKVPEGSGVCWCRYRRQVPEAGSGRFRKVLVCAGIGSGGNFRKVLEGFRRGSGELQCFRRFTRVPVWFVALQP